MTVNSYLTNRASNAILSTGEQDSINRSVATLQTRLNSYFSSKLNSHFRFGSSTRGTILPRRMDGHSDIDKKVDEQYADKAIGVHSCKIGALSLGDYGQTQHQDQK